MQMRTMRRLMGVLLLLSMLVTTALLVVQGRWQEAIPLHLCSVSALLAAVLSFKKSPAILDFLWYLGMPGAVLALIFPAPASSVMQPLFTAGYVVTHAMIAAIPLTAFAMGEEPRRGTAPTQLMALQALALTAFFVNRALGTDFLFLAAPPVRTPLEGIYRLSYGAYIAFLQGMMALLAWGMDAAGRRLFGRDDRPADFFAIQNSPNAV